MHEDDLWPKVPQLKQRIKDCGVSCFGAGVCRGSEDLDLDVCLEVSFCIVE